MNWNTQKDNNNRAIPAIPQNIIRPFGLTIMIASLLISTSNDKRRELFLATLYQSSQCYQTNVNDLTSRSQKAL